MSQTISGVRTATVTLSSASTTIAPGATINVAAGYNDLYGPAGTAWQVFNYGTIKGPASGSNDGIKLQNGGVVTNEATGVITAAYGVLINTGSGTVVNFGQITGARAAVQLNDGGLVDNRAGALYSSNFYAVVLKNGGTIINEAGAAIDASTSQYGIYAAGQNTTIINAGTIGEGTALAYEGIKIATGSFSADIDNQAGGLIASGVKFAIQSGAANTTLVNAGTISGTTEAADFLNNAIVTNSASGIITAAKGNGIGVYFKTTGSVLNAGSILAFKYGVEAAGTASVTNVSGGQIFGDIYGIKLKGTAATVINSGTVSDTGANAIVGIILTNTSGTVSVDNYLGGTISGGIKSDSLLYNALNVVNRGIISENVTKRSAIYSAGGATINNSSTGQILTSNVSDIEVNAGPLTLDNIGVIKTSGYDYGVAVINATTRVSELVNGGAGSNSGYIFGGQYGIAIAGAGLSLIENYGTVGGHIGINVSKNVTITNFGSIISTAGASGTAIKLDSISDLVRLAPTGVIIGSINDAAGNANGTGATVELLAGTATGTLNNLPAELVGIGKIIFDPGSNWNLSGSLISETISGFGQGDTIVLTGLSIGSETVNSGGTLLATQANPVKNVTINFGGEIVQGDLSFSVNGGSTTITTVKQTTIASGQTVTVASGTTANQILIASGGRESVASGGTLSGATIAGGVLELGAGSRIAGDIIFSGSGGVLIIDGTVPTNEIGGFTAGDTIELSGIAYNSAVDFVSVGTAGTVTVTAAGVSYDFDIYGVTVGQSNLVLSSDLALTETATCFAAGTKIAAAHDDVAVEDVRAGMMLHTLSGLRPVKWFGRRHIDLRRHANPDLVRPVCIRAGAIADGLPVRDLLVSPDHALYLEKILVPAKALINGHSIVQINVPEITYYHIELAAHGAVFAEGVAAETYLDTGNRHCFDGIGNVVLLHPDFAQARREGESFAPFAEAGPAVEKIRQALLDRAAIATTSEPDVRIVHTPQGARLISRWFVPGQLFADPRDKRRLGVKIAAILIDDVRLDLNHPALDQGWHEPEADGRWTNGNALIPKILLPGRGDVKVDIKTGGIYPNIVDVDVDVAVAVNIAR